MPAFHVEKSVEINASADTVYRIISDLNHWSKWSPWLVLEPETKVTVQPGGKEYGWEGKRTGTGNMKILKEAAPQRLDLEVNFLKPWKSTSKVWFELKPGNGSTRLTWFMDGSLPFFLFFMTKAMTAFLGMDYVRGLLMLKDYIETGSVPSRLDFKGIQSYAGCTYVGMRTSCTLETVGQKMREDFEKLGSWAQSHAGQLNGIPFSIYHTWDPVKNKIVYTSAFPVKELPRDLPAGAITGTIPALQVNTVTHTGPYRHLGNAWSAQQNMKQAKTFKSKKGVDPFETYVSMPGTAPENELVTEVHFPVA